MEYMKGMQLRLKQKNDQMALLFSQRQKELKKDESSKYSYYSAKNQRRDQLITDIKEALKEDNEQKKEIMELRRKDQRENYQRGLNFHTLYKQKLIEKIVEKKERAERVREQ